MIVSVPPPKRHKNEKHLPAAKSESGHARRPPFKGCFPYGKTPLPLMEIVAYSPSFVNGTARLFWYKIGSKSAPQKTCGGKLFVMLLPLCIAPVPPRIIKIRKNVQIRRKKVGKTCKSSRKTTEKCAKFS